MLRVIYKKVFAIRAKVASNEISGSLYTFSNSVFHSPSNVFVSFDSPFTVLTVIGIDEDFLGPSFFMCSQKPLGSSIQTSFNSLIVFFSINTLALFQQ